MTARAASALALLAVLLGAYGLFLADGGAVVRPMPDDGYDAGSRLTRLDDVLIYHRTFAYPLVLRAVRAVSPGYEWLPHLQAVLFLAAAGVLFAALLRTGLAPWTCFFASAPLAASPVLHQYAAHVLTDTLGAAAAVVALSCLLWLRATGGWVALASLTVATFLAYQIRPSSLFLVLFVPALLAVLPGRSLARLLQVAICCLAPLLAFCGLRYAVTGHFGLVSFGGYTAIGIAASLLSPRTIAGLPPDLVPLGGELLDRRRSLGLKPIETRTFGSPRERYEAWFSEVNLNVWNIAARPAFREARQRYRARFRRPPTGLAAGQALETANDADLSPAYLRWRADGRRWARMETNHLLSRLSRDLLRQRRKAYGLWLSQGLRYSAVRSFTAAPVLGWTLALATIGLASALLSRRLRRPRRPSSPGEALRAAATACGPFLLVAFGLAALSILIVVAIHRPLDRYLAAAVLLLPGGLAAFAWELGRRLIGGTTGPC